MKDNPDIAAEIDAEIRKEFFEKGEPLPEHQEDGDAEENLEEDDAALLEDEELDAPEETTEE